MGLCASKQIDDEDAPPAVLAEQEKRAVKKQEKRAAKKQKERRSSPKMQSEHSSSPRGNEAIAARRMVKAAAKANNKARSKSRTRKSTVTAKIPKRGKRTSADWGGHTHDKVGVLDTVVKRASRIGSLLNNDSLSMASRRQLYQAQADAMDEQEELEWDEISPA